MNIEEFRQTGYKAIDWICGYFENIEQYPVKSQVRPRDVYDSLGQNPPEYPENFDDIFADFEKKIMPGITHWQSPNFHAYFPANNSFPSIIGELLAAALGAQCMLWETSPAAAELEELVMNWLRGMIGLPSYFTGVIQDTASTATLAAVLSARERYSHFESNGIGLNENKFRIYCSIDAHSSIDKAVRISGIGSNNLVKIKTKDDFTMDVSDLNCNIINDLENGYIPLMVIAAFGTTGTTALDSIPDIAEIAQKYNLWYHIDAALAGSALILPEYRHHLQGVQHADSFVFNPHKWLFTNFDCSAYFVKDAQTLVNTFAITPEYLKTQHDNNVNNYRDWGVPLGRRFRALKLWFVIRSFGIAGLQEKIRLHLALTKEMLAKLQQDGDIEILAPVPLNTICFRYNPAKYIGDLNALNRELLKKINNSGKIYMTHTTLNGIYALRFVVAQTNIEHRHITSAHSAIRLAIRKL